MKTALFISPHLDDVAFSCGGTLLCLADDPNWRVVLCTIFTASVPDPQGFALRCQTDKGIAPEVDYLALRREEDNAYAATSGVGGVRHCDFREAPHRGYGSPAELFAGEREGDNVWRRVREGLAELNEELRPEVVFAPQGLGNHADHLQTIRAVLAVWPVERVCWYRDTPYAIREPSAQPAAVLPQAELALCRVPLSSGVLERKIAGCCRYASQIGFQFGGPEGVLEKLTAFHRQEAGGESPSAIYAETLLAHPNLHCLLPV